MQLSDLPALMIFLPLGLWHYRIMSAQCFLKDGLGNHPQSENLAASSPWVADSVSLIAAPEALCQMGAREKTIKRKIASLSRLFMPSLQLKAYLLLQALGYYLNDNRGTSGEAAALIWLVFSAVRRRPSPVSKPSRPRPPVPDLGSRWPYRAAIPKGWPRRCSAPAEKPAPAGSIRPHCGPLKE